MSYSKAQQFFIPDMFFPVPYFSSWQQFDVQTFFRRHIHIIYGVSLFLAAFKQAIMIKWLGLPRTNKSVQTLPVEFQVVYI